MGTQVATAVQQGAQNFRCVRVTDGTDLLRIGGAGSNASFTAIYTGSLGNDITATLSTGSQPNSWKLSVLLPGFEPEVFDGLIGNGAAFWTGLAAAVNAGLGPQRGPSQLIIASAGGTTASPAPFSLALGSSSPAPMARHLSAADSWLAPICQFEVGCTACGAKAVAWQCWPTATDSTTWTTQSGFALQEGLYIILTTPAGDTISNAVATIAAAGLKQLCHETDVW